MKSQRTNQSNSRPIASEEKLRFEGDVTRRGGERAADKAVRDLALTDDRVTKSGRLKVADVQRSEKKRR